MKEAPCRFLSLLSVNLVSVNIVYDGSSIFGCYDWNVFCCLLSGSALLIDNCYIVMFTMPKVGSMVCCIVS